MQVTKRCANGHHTLIFNVTERIPENYIETNKTLVDWTIQLRADASWGYSTVGSTIVANVNGKQVYNQYAQRSCGSNQTVTWASGTIEIEHEADGSKKVDFNCSYSQSSTEPWTPGNANLSGTLPLTTIPRASSITSNISFIKGDIVTFTLKRASTNFTHTLKVKIADTLIKTITDVKDSYTWTPNTSEVELMLKAGTTVSAECITYNGKTQIGNATSKTGTANNPTLSTVKDTPNVILNSSIPLNITRNKDFYSHTLTIKLGSTILKNITNIGTSTTLSFTNTEINTIYGLVKNSPTATLTVECITYIRGANAGKTSKNGTLTIPNTGNEPVFTGWTYKGLNTIANNVLGTDQVLIQNYNGIEITCNQAEAKNQANILKYQAIINGLTFETTDLTNRKINVSNLNLGGMNTCQVRVIDSRGFITTIEKTIEFINYFIPEVSDISIKRKNNYDKEVTLSLKGLFSKLFYNKTVKNDVLSFKVRYKKIEDKSYGEWIDIQTSKIPDTSTNYYIDYEKGEVGLKDTVIGDFTIENTFNFQFLIQDKLEELFFTSILTNGIPLISLRKGKVGINCVPKDDDPALIVNGKIKTNDAFILKSGNEILDYEIVDEW